MSRNGRQPTWDCPRCGEVGDPRHCVCMRNVRRWLEEARREINLGRSLSALGKISAAEKQLKLLDLDAAKAAGINTGG